MGDRLLLFHWNETEAEERAERLRRAAYVVDTYWQHEGEGYRKLRKDPRSAYVIDLSRLPSHGRAVGVWLRQQKATRDSPVVFVCDDSARLDRARELLPDATFTPWKRIRGSIRRAIAKPPPKPVVPDTMAGYSKTPLPKKLNIKPGATVALLGAPGGFDKYLGTLPERVRFKRQARGTADTILLFVRSRAELERRFPAAVRTLAQRGGLWIAWPKKSSGVTTNLTQGDVRKHGLDSGLVDYKICAIDETWSGLLFARRR